MLIFAVVPELNSIASSIIPLANVSPPLDIRDASGNVSMTQSFQTPATLLLLTIDMALAHNNKAIENPKAFS